MAHILPFSIALEESRWNRHQERFTNETTCEFCQCEFVEDTDTQRWYPQDEVIYGDEPPACEEVVPVQTQFGWFCSQGCFHDYVLENEVTTQIGVSA